MKQTNCAKACPTNCYNGCNSSFAVLILFILLAIVISGVACI